MTGPGKSYQEWIFDLEEFLVGQGLPASAQSFEKGALVYGFTNGLSPADFVKDKVNTPKPVKVVSPKPAPPVTVATPKHQSLRLSNDSQGTSGARILGAVLFVLGGFGAFYFYSMFF